MDAEYINPTRIFPSYTTQDLRDALTRTEYPPNEETAARIREEIRHRETGESRHHATPQVPPLLQIANASAGRILIGTIPS